MNSFEVQPATSMPITLHPPIQHISYHSTSGANDRADRQLGRCPQRILLRAMHGPRNLRRHAARGALRALSVKLSGTPPGSHVLIRCHPADETSTRGPLNRHVRTLRAKFVLESLTIRADAAVRRGLRGEQLPGPGIAQRQQAPDDAKAVV